MSLLAPRLKIRLGRLRQEATARLLAKIPRSALRLIPGSSRSFGPPRRSATLRDYLARHPGEWIPLLPAATSAYPPPKSLPKFAETLRRKFAPVAWPEAGLAMIPDGRVLDDNAWPVGCDDTFLYEFSFLGERPTCPIHLIRNLAKPTKTKGTALNLGSCWARINYGHFIFDALPRLELFHRAGLSLNDVDHILLPHFTGSSAASLLARLQLPPEKILRLERGKQYAFDRLIQPSYPGASAFYRPLVADFYRRPEFKTNPPPSPHRRLYLPRHGVRRISNETEIAALLAARGFETVDFRAITNEPGYFAEVDVMVGAHGAGLSSLVFCQPGARLLELLPSNHVFPFFYSAASAARLDYWAVLGGAEAAGDYNEYGPPNDADFHIAPADLTATLDAIGIR